MSSRHNRCCSHDVVPRNATAPSCSDNLWNQGETAVDCGGPNCLHTCTLGRGCTVHDDCWSEQCGITGRCARPSTCFNKVKDCWKGKCETGVDCGKTSTCGLCAPLQGCDSHADCREGVCGADGKCAVPSCDDGVMNGAETCIDGGATCLRGCANGGNCTVHADCESGRCWLGTCAGE